MLSARKIAAEKGSTTYQGPSCKNCGNTIRYVLSSGCIKCANERAKTYAKRKRAELQAAIVAARGA